MTIKVRIDRVEIHIHGADATEILEAIAGLREDAMSKFTDVQALLDAMNAVTNQLASNVSVVVANEAAQLEEIRSLKAQIESGQPVTQEQLDALVTTMTARVDALRATEQQLAAIATNPDEPIPEVPPVTGEGGTEGESEGAGATDSAGTETP